jgi:hypothetical protein
MNSEEEKNIEIHQKMIMIWTFEMRSILRHSKVHIFYRLRSF